MIGRAFGLAAPCLVAASTVFAQPAAPISRFVVDVRAATVGLPTAEGWTPTVPEGTLLPARGLGFAVGGEVLLVRGRRVSLGAGGSFVRGGGTQTPVEGEEAASSTALAIPEVATTMTIVAPHVSLNFGHRMGWSYVSAGVVSARVTSEARGTGALVAGGPSDRVAGFHFGGGARWFLNEHVGVTFDLRWHQLGSVATTAAFPGARRQRMLVASAGLSLR